MSASRTDRPPDGPRIVPDDESGRAEAVAILRGGGVVAFATDTVYGIAVAIDTPGGIGRLFHVKHRPLDKAIALLLAEAAQAAELGALSPEAQALADAFWPGPLTLVLRAHADARLPDVLSGGAATVGVRLPDHATPRALAAAVGPLPTTSGNRSGAPDPLDAASVAASLGDGVDLILDGGTTPGVRPSTVVDTTTDPPAVLRVGLIDEATVRATLTAASAVGR